MTRCSILSLSVTLALALTLPLTTEPDPNHSSKPKPNPNPNEGTRKAVNAGRRFRLHLQNASAAEASGGDPTLELFQGDTLMNRFALALAR